MPQAQQLGRYHLLDRIAFGGMAEIFRAKTFDKDGHVHLVAVKRVLAHLVEDQDFLQMLVDEAKISALLHHDNIARVYEFSKAHDEYFLAMEFVDGKDVRSLLEQGRQSARPLPPEHVAWVAMETANALHAAHTQRDGAGRALRIVHRDVSPSNVLCSYHGEVKLCDFGIAKATLTRVQTKTGVIKGKVKYMSPEQAMGRKLDHRSDLFSLGTVMYEMLTLQAPFQAPTEVELIFAVRDARKIPLREVLPDLSEDMVRIVDKAMTRSRAHRYQSGEELALELRIFLDRHSPGYRRSHFSRYMRKVFDDDIEKELRQMEGYVIGEVDEKQTGINLIAEALGPDAPFTQFTPMFGSPVTTDRTAHYPHLDPVRPSDLHGQPTMMLDRARLGLPPEEHDSAINTNVPPDPAPVPSLHELATRLLPRVHAERSIHDEETGEKELPTVEGFRRSFEDGEPSPLEMDTGAMQKIAELDLAVQPSHESHEDTHEAAHAASDQAPSDLHAQSTMIFLNPLGEGPPTGPFTKLDASHPTPFGLDQPPLATVQSLPPSAPAELLPDPLSPSQLNRLPFLVDESFAEEAGDAEPHVAPHEEDEASVPLDDEDLEEL